MLVELFVGSHLCSTTSAKYKAIFFTKHLEYFASDQFTKRDFDFSNKKGKPAPGSRGPQGW